MVLIFLVPALAVVVAVQETFQGQVLQIIGVCLAEILQTV